MDSLLLTKLADEVRLSQSSQFLVALLQCVKQTACGEWHNLKKNMKIIFEAFFPHFTPSFILWCRIEPSKLCVDSCTLEKKISKPQASSM